ncbi:FecCD family ABC transporter permease [Piscinibacter sakaiensis]|uniref:Iron(III) dicitrate transport system permease protein FecD n=1 Tax=Piscinibacter sakaiensis TaxID=1547922 RepID=A0A0K8NZ32_PISS1|nr:iron ABC transporter permease [Piscinibacter sakaiensis]GAP35646.1 iron(III) dicitrate transport system permease protein FecD [Piscinibacter sakaiensis]
MRPHGDPAGEPPRPWPPPRAAASAPRPSSAAPAPAAHARLTDAARRRRLATTLAALVIAGLLAGLATGADGFSPSGLVALWQDGQAGLIVGEIRLPRSLGAALVGALLGLAGALAQGLFRNPLADPYLLGSAAGAGLAVVGVLAAATLGGVAISLATAAWIERIGLVVAAFAGALGGVALTLSLARGAAHTLRLLLAGVVVGVLMGAASDLITVASPDALRGKQAFLLGSTSFIGPASLAAMAAGLGALLLLSRRLARGLDALTLGEDSAASLGLDLGRTRLALVLMLSLATALAVSQAGLVAFVGLVAPHLVRRHAPGPHAWLLPASAAMGAVLLLGADVLSRAALAPQELPVGVVTGVLGGLYLFVLLRRRGLG